LFRSPRRRAAGLGERGGPAVTSLPVRADITVTGTRWANSNGSRGHHYAHQKLMNTWRDLATIAAKGQGPVDAPVVITATVRRTQIGRQDAHRSEERRAGTGGRTRRSPHRARQ